jgi:hypothetical protein
MSLQSRRKSGGKEVIHAADARPITMARGMPRRTADSRGVMIDVTIG